MLTPEYLYRVSEASEELASQLHNYIIRKIIERIMVRLGRCEKYLLTATDKWQIEALQDAGYLLEDITEEIPSGLFVTHSSEKVVCGYREDIITEPPELSKAIRIDKQKLMPWLRPCLHILLAPSRS